LLERIHLVLALAVNLSEYNAMIKVLFICQTFKETVVLVQSNYEIGKGKNASKIEYCVSG
jgi:hypothetical protein